MSTVPIIGYIVGILALLAGLALLLLGDSRTPSRGTRARTVTATTSQTA